VTVRLRPTSFFFLSTVFCVSFEQVHWNIAGTVSIADVLAILFLTSFIATRWVSADAGLNRTAAILIGFLGAFLLVYLTGFFNLDTTQALDQYVKGLVKFLIHFCFLIAGVAYLARRSQRYFWRTLAWFVAGLTVNALYGVAQLLFAKAGHNLDHLLLARLTGGASSINIYGIVGGANVYRPQALTGDPNHLAIMLEVPLLVLTPLYLRLERGHKLRYPLALLLSFLLLVELATLSRSGLLGLSAGALLLAVVYRGKLRSKELLVPLGGLAALLAYILYRRSHFFSVVLRSRLQTNGRSGESAHFAVYSFIPQILHTHPLLGLGINNFSVYYQFVTGKSNWGPHSFYVALLVETGVVGTALFAGFVIWVFRRLSQARQLGRLLARQPDPLAARVRPLSWGLTAALIATMVANIFYLTMQFYYFYAFIMLALATPIVFARNLQIEPRGATRSSAALAATSVRSPPPPAPPRAAGHDLIARATHAPSSGKPEADKPTHPGRNQPTTRPSRRRLNGYLGILLVVALIGATAAAFAITETLKLQPSPITNTEVDKLFSPTCHCPTNRARIAFRLRQADRLTVTIVNASGHPIRTLLNSQPVRTGRHQFVWDGRDNNGQIAPDGTYRPRVHLAEQHRTILLPNPIQLDTKPPQITFTQLQPRTITAGKQAIVVSYQLDKPAHAILYVDGRLAVFTRFQPLRGSLRWFGKRTARPLHPGIHQLTLAAQDPAGNRSHPQTIGTIRLRRQAARPKP
jgi:hypothetical protein